MITGMHIGLVLYVKGATIATGAVSKWGGAMIKLSGLSTCLLYSAN